MIPTLALLAVFATALLGTGCIHTIAPLSTLTAVGLECSVGRWYKIVHLAIQKKEC